MNVLPPNSGRGVYGISVAAELTGLGVQTLRLYESRGLLEPTRTEGGTRRYSADDLDRLNRIGSLLNAGLNLAGVRMVMDLQDANAELETRNSRLQSENRSLRDGGTGRAATGARRASSPTSNPGPERAANPRPEGAVGPPPGQDADGRSRARRQDGPRRRSGTAR